MFKVVFSTFFCEKYFLKIPKNERDKILDFIEARIAVNPREAGRQLKGNLSGYWRSRCGNYRIIYSIMEDKVIVEIVRIDHRKNIYSW